MDFKSPPIVGKCQMGNMKYTEDDALNVIIGAFSAGHSAYYDMQYAISDYAKVHRHRAISQITRTRFAVRGVKDSLGLPRGDNDRNDVIFVEFDQRRKRSLFNFIGRNFTVGDFMFLDYNGYIIAYIDEYAKYTSFAPENTTFLGHIISFWKKFGRGSEPGDMMTVGEWVSKTAKKGEIFKPVRGYNGVYLISNQGRVVTTKGRIGHKHPQLLKSHKNKNYGYEQVMLWKNSHAKLHYVHRLVAEAFVHNPEGYRYVKFKDGKCRNCKSSNLYWAKQINPKTK